MKKIKTNKNSYIRKGKRRLKEGRKKTKTKWKSKDGDLVGEQGKVEENWINNGIKKLNQRVKKSEIGGESTK